MKKNNNEVKEKENFIISWISTILILMLLNVISLQIVKFSSDIYSLLISTLIIIVVTLISSILIFLTINLENKNIFEN